MNNEELVRREDVLARKCKYYVYDETGCCRKEFAVPVEDIERIPAIDAKPVPAGGIGEMSDGHHTFNGLYYQRMMLFAALVKVYKDRAWKSYRHEDGELCFGGGCFIVGIDTPAGSYTYHYKNEYFDLFECKELPTGKHWDGHTEKDVTRLLKLEPADVKPVIRGKWITHYCAANGHSDIYCSVCNKDATYFVGSSDEIHWSEEYPAYCPNCGAEMRMEENDGR